MSSGGVYTNLEKCGPRRADDFYPTPREATEAFCRAELAAFRRFPVWEPACGAGAISEVLKAHGCTVFSTDLADRGYGEPGRDFLDDHAPRPPPAIITNPPFRLAEDFIRHAHALRAPYVAMLLKTHYFSAGKRLRLYDDLPPSRIYPLSWRLDFTGAGSPHTECSWFVWDAAWPHGYTRFMRPLERPDPLGLSVLERMEPAPEPRRRLTPRERGESPKQLLMTPAAREADAAFERWYRGLPRELRTGKRAARRKWAQQQADIEGAA